MQIGEGLTDSYTRKEDNANDYLAYLTVRELNLFFNSIRFCFQS